MIHAIVTSKLDYCNSLFVGLPLDLIWKFQLVQNAAACMLTKSPLPMHIQSVLCQLQWLPIVYWIHVKLLMLIFKVLFSQGPVYLWGCLFPYEPRRAFTLSQPTSPGDL